MQPQRGAGSGARVTKFLRLLKASHRVLKTLHGKKAKSFQNPKWGDIGMDFQRTVAAFDDILMTTEETD